MSICQLTDVGLYQYNTFTYLGFIQFT